MGIITLTYTYIPHKSFYLLKRLLCRNLQVRGRDSCWLPRTMANLGFYHNTLELWAKNFSLETPQFWDLNFQKRKVGFKVIFVYKSEIHHFCIVPLLPGQPIYLQSPITSRTAYICHNFFSMYTVVYIKSLGSNCCRTLCKVIGWYSIQNRVEITSKHGAEISFYFYYFLLNYFLSIYLCIQDSWDQGCCSASTTLLFLNRNREQHFAEILLHTFCLSVIKHVFNYIWKLEYLRLGFGMSVCISHIFKNYVR